MRHPWGKASALPRRPEACDTETPHACVGLGLSTRVSAMKKPKTFSFDTLSLHAGARPDPSTGARATPIYQTTAYAFRDAEHAARLFNLQEVGFIYSRLTNPTVSVLEERLAALEGGRGAVACGSGHASQLLTFSTLLTAGDEFVAARNLYGGSITQFSYVFKNFGWKCHFVDPAGQCRTG